MLSVTLQNGITIHGITEEHLKRIISGDEDGIHYLSATKGKIKIADMATPHLRNAILKFLRESLETAKFLKDEEFAEMLENGIAAKNITALAMIKEMSFRTSPF